MATQKDRPDPKYSPPLDLPDGAHRRGKPGFDRRAGKEAFAESMRLLPTYHEQLLRVILLEMKVYREFKEQEVLFGYIADFAHSGFRGSSRAGCYPFIIEVDGDTHLSSYAKRKDRERDGVFNKHGFRVLRITHSAIKTNVREVKQAIAEWLDTGVTSPHDNTRPKLILRRTISGPPGGRGSVLPDVGRNRGAGRGTKGKR
jgi:very-short-patch-repair endonuclease